MHHAIRVGVVKVLHLLKFLEYLCGDGVCSQRAMHEIQPEVPFSCRMAAMGQKTAVVHITASAATTPATWYLSSLD